jgi:hypothetical protein
LHIIQKLYKTGEVLFEVFRATKICDSRLRYVSGQLYRYFLYHRNDVDDPRGNNQAFWMQYHDSVPIGKEELDKKYEG